MSIGTAWSSLQHNIASCSIQKNDLPRKRKHTLRHAGYHITDSSGCCGLAMPRMVVIRIIEINSLAANSVRKWHDRLSGIWSMSDPVLLRHNCLIHLRAILRQCSLITPKIYIWTRRAGSLERQDPPEIADPCWPDAVSCCALFKQNLAHLIFFRFSSFSSWYRGIFMALARSEKIYFLLDLN